MWVRFFLMEKKRFGLFPRLRMKQNQLLFNAVHPRHIQNGFALSLNAQEYSELK